MKSNLPACSTLFLCLFLIAGPALGAGKSDRYVTLRYRDGKDLHTFNDNLTLGRRLSYNLRGKNLLTVEDEVQAKVDLLVEKAEVVLNMFPDRMRITLVLLPSSAEVSRVYREKYGKKVHHIAYYSLAEDTVYISVEDTSLRVLAHELGHAVVDHYFTVRPPYKIHELMAQFTEKHITD